MLWFMHIEKELELTGSYWSLRLSLGNERKDMWFTVTVKPIHFVYDVIRLQYHETWANVHIFPNCIEKAWDNFLKAERNGEERDPRHQTWGLPHVSQENALDVKVPTCNGCLSASLLFLSPDFDKLANSKKHRCRPLDSVWLHSGYGCCSNAFTCPMVPFVIPLRPQWRTRSLNRQSFHTTERVYTDYVWNSHFGFSSNFIYSIQTR